MKTPLATFNLWHEKVRTSVALAGVAFAAVLILMQLGFYGSVKQTATRIYDALEFDLLLLSPRYAHLANAGTLPHERLTEALADPDVVDARPLYLGYSLWRNVETGRRRGILVMGVDPREPGFTLPELRPPPQALEVLGRVLMDSRSRPEFGARTPGLQTDLGRTRVTLAGQFTLGTGFAADGAVLAGERTFARLFPQRPPNAMSLGLVRLRPGADPLAVAARLHARLPIDVRVATREEISASEREHWLQTTSVGIVFGLGVAVALLVGSAIVYQVLASDVTNRLPEYATLKAMGYGPASLAGIVLRQAWMIALVGFLPGLALSLALYDFTASLANIPMELPWSRAAWVLLACVAMCSMAGLISLRKVQTADPADLFR